MKDCNCQNEMQKPDLKNFADVKKFVEENGITTLDFKYSDLVGKMRHLTLPVSRLSEKLLKEGEAFDASSTSGLKAVESGDMVIIPDISTAVIDPFWDVPTLSFICRIADAETKEFFHMDPRGVAVRAEEYMKKLGIADESLWAPEYEFYLFDKIFIRNSDNFAMYYIGSEEHNFNAVEDLSSFADRQEKATIIKNDGYHSSPPAELYYQVREEMVQIIEQFGWKVRYHHHEVGAASQHEIEVMPVGAASAGDMTTMVKYVVKMVAERYGIIATFMPKPLYNRPGTGMHFHQFLRKGGKNLFFKKGEYADLSETALYYIGGILKHGPAITAFMNPSINSYKRLVPGFEAPISLVYSKGNRSAAIRIPKNFTSEEDKRIEYRTGDPTCNPYLAVSAMLMAALDGIQNKIDPREYGFGPFDANLDHLPAKDMKKIKQIPLSLDAALDALEKDHEFLLKGDVFNKDIIEKHIAMKRKDSELIRNRPHPFEFEQYFNC